MTVDSTATTQTGVTNPCDYEGCSFEATHRVRRNSPIVGPHNDLEVCDEHLRDEIRSGSTHLEWFDAPQIESRKVER